MTLEEKITSKHAVIAVVGIGYVGLPLAVAFAKAGYDVIGIDTNPQRVDMVQCGKSYVKDVTDDDVAIATERLRATTCMGSLISADVILVCVPTPLTKTKDPDMQYIESTARSIALCLRNKERLVIFESTTYPGTTREVVLPILMANYHESSPPFHLAYSPEMVDPGNTKFGLRNTPKVVGGIDKESRRLAVLVYQQVADDVIPVSSPEVAEMVKVFSNVFRNVNIALVNELAQLCERMGVGVWEVLSTVAQKPFGYMPFSPGPGTGGHCLPDDPYYLSAKAREHDFHTRFIELAATVNEQMPYHVAEGIAKALSDKREKAVKGSRILVLGVAYKKDVADTRESPSLKLMELLLNRGAKVDYCDPFVPEVVLVDGVRKTGETDIDWKYYDCVVIAVDHTDFVAGLESIIEQSDLIYDAKGITYVATKAENVVRLGE